MKVKMNNEELSIMSQLVILAKEYEENTGDIERPSIYEKMQKISPCGIDIDFLENYRKSMDLEEFCLIHSVQKENVKNITGENVRNILLIVLNSLDDSDLSEYFLLKYSDAIEYYYMKNSGALMESLYERNIRDHCCPVKR